MTRATLKRALFLAPLMFLLCASDCSDDPEPARPYGYISREDEVCEFRQYFPKQDGQNVRVITYKRVKGLRRWAPVGSPKVAERVTAMQGLADARPVGTTTPFLLAEGSAKQSGPDPRL